MKPQYTWSIDKIQVAAEEDGRVDVVKAVHWSCSASMNDVVKSTNGIKRIADNAFIPFDPANTDYAEYLRWLEAGNQPLPADAQPE